MNVECRYRKVTGKTKEPWSTWRSISPVSHSGELTARITSVLERYDYLGYVGAVVKVRAGGFDEQFRAVKP